MIKFRPQNSFITSDIIDFRVTNCYFNNQNLFSTYAKYKYNFEIKIGEKFIAYYYSNVNIKISDLKSNTITLMVININLTLKLDYNLLNTIFLAKKIL